MPRKPSASAAANTITAWSFSRLSVYEQCPAKAKYQIIDKLPTSQNDAMARGNNIHKMCEKYVKGQLDALPEELQLFDEEFDQLYNMFHYQQNGVTVRPEEKWAFTKTWVPTDYFGVNTFLRVVVDCAILNEKEGRLTIIDYKTGKIRDGYDDQLNLYAAAGFAMFPGVSTISTELWYLDQGEIKGGGEEVDDDGKPIGLYERDSHDSLVKAWDKRIKSMIVDKRFAPKPSNLCRWCDFSKANGGPCEY